MDLAQRIYNKIIIDGQAYLYAKMLQFQAEAKGEVVSDQQLNEWQDEWKVETRKLVNDVVNPLREKADEQRPAEADERYAG